jgi:hypothetical protein
MEYLDESLGWSSAASRCARNMPSYFAPTRRSALLDRSFLASVWKHTLWTCHVSKAKVSISRFISVFAPVLMAERASQVWPISQVSGAS